MIDLSRSDADHDLAALQARVLRRRQRYAQSTASSSPAATRIVTAIRQLWAQPGTMPARFALHLLVGLIVPLAMVINPAPFMPLPLTESPPSTSPADVADFVVPLAPLSLDDPLDGEIPMPDSAFADIDALPVPALTPDLLAPQIIKATGSRPTPF